MKGAGDIESIDKAKQVVDRACDQLDNGVSLKEIDFDVVASTMQSAIDELRGQMTLEELKEYCAGPWCEGCKHRDCVLFGTEQGGVRT